LTKETSRVKTRGVVDMYASANDQWTRHARLLVTLASSLKTKPRQFSSVIVYLPLVHCTGLNSTRFFRQTMTLGLLANFTRPARVPQFHRQVI